MVCIVVHICRCRCLSTQFPYHKTHVLDQTSTAWTQQLMCMSIYGVCVCTNTYIHFYVHTHTHTHILNTVSIYIYPHIFYNYKHGYIQTKASQYPSHLLTEAPYQKVEDSTASSALSCNAIRCWHFDVFQPRPLGSFEVWGCLRLTFCWKSTSSKNAKSACLPVICLNVEPRIVYSPYPSRNNLCTYQRLNSQQTYLSSSKNINGLNAARNSGVVKGPH